MQSTTTFFWHSPRLSVLNFPVVFGLAVSLVVSLEFVTLPTDMILNRLVSPSSSPTTITVRNAGQRVANQLLMFSTFFPLNKKVRPIWVAHSLLENLGDVLIVSIDDPS